MKITPFLLISTLFICGYLVPGIASSKETLRFSINNLIKEFSRCNYEYKLLSMSLRQSDVAYLGTAKLIEKLAKDKNDFADMCMNYLVTRNQHDLRIHIWKYKTVNWGPATRELMTPEWALQYAYVKENNLGKILRQKLEFIEAHGKHFLEHNILDTQYDSLSRLNNLLTASKRNISDYVYLYEFDRSVPFLYRNYFTVPFDSSIDL